MSRLELIARFCWRAPAIVWISMLAFFLTTSFGPQALALTSDSQTSSAADNGKSVDELLLEAQQLFAADHPIDARSKLLKAMQVAPNDYRPPLRLSEYFLAQVAHFSLAYRYAHKASELFEKQYGNEESGQFTDSVWREHAHLLYVLAEAALNFDRYDEALSILERYGRIYWDGWYPGTKAWVLMKLKRIDDGIREAQAGLLRGADPGRTYNILGILLSVKGNRELSLEAFSRAIRTELAQGGDAQPATPLNNAGEVYRELFEDNLAEAAWKTALQYPDGCDHILPSLNLATLYIDELRLFQAERALSDFEACFAARSLRSDTEHRSLIHLARGRIALRKGDVDDAIKQLTYASERQQWFGKIGTNENDVRFSANISLAQAFRAKANTLNDVQRSTIAAKIADRLAAQWFRARAWWLSRRAQEIAIDELFDFEDLFIRNTDAMLEYPTLGSLLAEFPEDVAKRRLERMLSTDNRTPAAGYYDLYLATNYISHGDDEGALSLLDRAQEHVRSIDRLLSAEILVRQIIAKDGSKPFWHSLTTAEALERQKQVEELYKTLPSHVRNYDFNLPVVIETAGNATGELEKLKDMLLNSRFTTPRDDIRDQARYLLLLSANNSSRENEDEAHVINFSVELRDRLANDHVVVHQADVNMRESGKLEQFVNEFVNKAFSHRFDPPSEPTPELPIMKGLLD